jgi:hypothetical protein
MQKSRFSSLPGIKSIRRTSLVDNKVEMDFSHNRGTRLNRQEESGYRLSLLDGLVYKSGSPAFFSGLIRTLRQIGLPLLFISAATSTEP